jgi:hypothetical protein
MLIVSVFELLLIVFVFQAMKQGLSPHVIENCHVITFSFLTWIWQRSTNLLQQHLPNLSLRGTSLTFKNTGGIQFQVLLNEAASVIIPDKFTESLFH